MNTYGWCEVHFIRIRERFNINDVTLKPGLTLKRIIYIHPQATDAEI